MISLSLFNPLFCSLGAVFLDSLNSTAPVISVSLLPPPPQPKNTARMLALALAESAQATILSQRESSEPPTPVSPIGSQEFLEAHDWLPPPTYKLQTSQEETSDVPRFPATSSSSAPCTPTETLTQSTSMHLIIDDIEKTMAGNREDISVSSASVAPSKGASNSQPVQLPPTPNSPERQQPSVGQTPSSNETCSITLATITSTDSRNELVVTPQKSSKVRFEMLIIK